MKIFLWHVHGSWMTSFVQGNHEYYVPVLPDRGSNGLGRALAWDWPEPVIEVSPQEAADLDFDVLIVQREEELSQLAERWTGKRPGLDIPTIFLEHNTPQGRIADMRHPAADRNEIFVVHVTHFNRLFWDTGSTPATVIEHGIIDPGYRYTGEIRRSAVVVNEPGRRGRVAGTDLLGSFTRIMPIDLFGMGVGSFGGFENLPQEKLHEEIPKRRLYFHPNRWTSLGLSLIEAMQLGMPVVALGTTEVPETIPSSAGFVSNKIDVLMEGVRMLSEDRDVAVEMGKSARKAALTKHGLGRFLRAWDQLLEEVA